MSPNITVVIAEGPTNCSDILESRAVSPPLNPETKSSVLEAGAMHIQASRQGKSCPIQHPSHATNSNWLEKATVSVTLKCVPASRESPSQTKSAKYGLNTPLNLKRFSIIHTRSFSNSCSESSIDPSV